MPNHQWPTNSKIFTIWSFTEKVSMGKARSLNYNQNDKG